MRNEKCKNVFKHVQNVTVATNEFASNLTENIGLLLAI